MIKNKRSPVAAAGKRAVAAMVKVRIEKEEEKNGKE